jgi:hypothetical protein
LGFAVRETTHELLAMNTLRSLASLAAPLVPLLCLASSASGQGADGCALPTGISGTGAFAFSNVGATTGAEGQTDPACFDTTAQTAIHNDVWFSWTAPTTDTYEITTCGGTFIDSKLAVYAGVGCPAGGALDCNDDTCGTQSQVSFAATSGASYTIQLGNWPSAAPGGGQFFLSVFTPPPPCSTSAGPDVIVGDLQEIENYAAGGGLDAISLGTFSCNIGTSNLNWFASTNQHPVIGGALYRWRTTGGYGTFEQIGMSWLKHGFFALSLNLCCANCQSTDGTTLGVNCADPYTASRNGTQFGLGPRWQVNAHTGAFTYPPANPSWSGTTARRLEFAQSDAVTTAGVRYFAEGQYVTPDDAAAGNQNNNASYRELAIDAGGANFSFAGSTQRELSAIRAWPLVESGVVLQDVQVPGEGLFVVGCKTTSLGGGQYHYEYAVYNMNSDRAGGSFTIPLPSGAVVTNVGFHGVTYRNGDGNGSVNFSSAPWTVRQTASSLTWTTEAVTANANANALRWGTTYNFRFDADVAPAQGLATLGLWKTGSPAGVSVPVDVPSGNGTTFFCAGDGSTIACPCANHSVAGAFEGCLSSLALGGRLRALGNASIVADTLSLSSTQVPDGPALYFQGSGQTVLAFGDGLLCTTGTLVRLGVVFAAGGASAYPAGTDPAVSVQGGVAAGDVRNYQAWYRDAAAFCTVSTFNLTNGARVNWGP